MFLVTVTRYKGMMSYFHTLAIRTPHASTYLECRMPNSNAHLCVVVAGFACQIYVRAMLHLSGTVFILVYSMYK